MGIVEVDGGLQCAARDRHADTGGKVLGHIRLEFIEQDEELSIRRRESESCRIQVDNRCACVLKGLHSFFECIQHRLWRCYVRETAQSRAGYTELCALKTIRVYALGIVGM